MSEGKGGRELGTPDQSFACLRSARCNVRAISDHALCCSIWTGQEPAVRGRGDGAEQRCPSGRGPDRRRRQGDCQAAGEHWLEGRQPSEPVARSLLRATDLISGVAKAAARLQGVLRIHQLLLCATQASQVTLKEAKKEAKHASKELQARWLGGAGSWV